MAFHIKKADGGERWLYEGGTDEAIILPAVNEPVRVQLSSGTGVFETTESSLDDVQDDTAVWVPTEEQTGPWQGALGTSPRAVRFVGTGEFVVAINRRGEPL